MKSTRTPPPIATPLVSVTTALSAVEIVPSSLLQPLSTNSAKTMCSAAGVGVAVAIGVKLAVNVGAIVGVAVTVGTKVMVAVGAGGPWMATPAEAVLPAASVTVIT